MSFLNRLQGVIFNPQPTMKAIAEKPVWVDVLIVVLIAVGLFNFLIAPYTMKDQAQMYENNPGFRERLGEERYNKAIQDFNNPTTKAKIIQAVVQPVFLLIGFFFSSLFLLLFGRMFSTEGKYLAILAVNVSANLIDKIAGNAVRLFLILSKKSAMSVTPSLAILFPKLDVLSTPFIILSQIDFFQLWMFGVMAYGLAVVFKIELKKALIVAFAFWLIKALLYIGVVIVSKSFIA